MTKSRTLLLRMIYFKNTLIRETLRKYAPELFQDPKSLYLLTEDIDEIMQWPDDEVNKIIVVMGGILHNYGNKLIRYIDDALICPWCLRQKLLQKKPLCLDCKYGERHGKCIVDDPKDSTYSMICKGIPTPFIRELPGLLCGVTYILADYMEDQG